MSSNEDQDPYGAIKFGEFRKYMQNKKSKLKKQQDELIGSQLKPQLFHGCAIHINGYTNPPTSDLRRMIIERGGDFQHYLIKSSVTHIIATNLTNSKLQEFRSYKVVKPEWITESIREEKLLPWQNYRLVSRAAKQKELSFNRIDQPTANDVNINPSAVIPPPPPTEIITRDTPVHTIPAVKPNTTTLMNENIAQDVPHDSNDLTNEWKRSVSTANPKFIKRYYETSRLHHLSMWKSELKDIVDALVEKYPKPIREKRKLEPRIVMHIDFDCFFASVGLVDRPQLKDKPVAVSHSKGASEDSSSDVASCNYIARSFGLKNGMSIGKAKKLCPHLQVIPYEFEKYKIISETFYRIVFRYADEIQPVSVDEALIEVGSHITAMNAGQEEALAAKIRNEIKEATRCEASIGIGRNILLARLSTKKAKPAGQYYCNTQHDIDTMFTNTKVIDVPGVGYAMSEKLNSMNVDTVMDVRKMALHELQSKLGTKMGQTLYNFSRGIDDRPLMAQQQRQSVSADVNWGMRFENESNQKEFVEGLSKEISDRLKKLKVKGKTITVKILKRKEEAGEARKHLGHGIVDTFSKSYTLSNYTDDPHIINKHAYSMLQSFQFSYIDMRGFGIQITRLDNTQTVVSASQDVLKFKAGHIEPTEPLKHQGESSTSTTHTKQVMPVDAKVFSELPATVQQELINNYDLHIENKETNKGDVALPDLPPWSQLDPDTLLELPDTMRDQILNAYRNKAPPIIKSPPRTPHRQRKTPPSSGSRNRTLTSMFTPSRAEEYDVNIWNELPSDIQKELLAEHTNKQKRIVQPNETKKQTIEEDSATLSKIQVELVAQEPSIQGVSDLNQVRELIHSWVSQCSDHPEQEDANTFCTYLLELVKVSDLEKVRLLVIYLNYLTQHSTTWKNTMDDIKKRVSDLVTAMYGYPLRF